MSAVPTPAPRVALASASPQRAQLLGELISPDYIQQLTSGHDETALPGERPVERVARLAREKADRVLADDRFGPAVEFIIGADTEIAIDVGGRLEEVAHPATTEEAIAVLGRLAGCEHVALTGVAVIGRDPKDDTVIKRVEAAVATIVEFRDLTPDEIVAYAETGEPLGRAGGYAIQERGSSLVSRIEGSYSNVVGLPVERLVSILRDDFAHPIFPDDPASTWSAPPRPLRRARP